MTVAAMGGADDRDRQEGRKRRRVESGLDMPEPGTRWDTFMLLVTMHVCLMWNWLELMYREMLQYFRAMVLGYYSHNGFPRRE